MPTDSIDGYAMKGLLIFIVGFCVIFVAHPVNAQTFDKGDTAAYDAFLHDHVRNGGVDFQEACKDSRLGQFLNSAARTNPQQIVISDDRLAFWINVYNAYNLKAICDRYPVKSMLQLGFGPLLVQAAMGKTVWDKPMVAVAGKKYALKHIEHGVIHKEFADPKIQFALFCGAVSCPPLRNEAYNGDRLQAQMTDQAKVFFGSNQWNTFDLTAKTATLSPIMDWNAKYFGQDQAKVLRFISEFSPSDVGKSLGQEPQAWTITYSAYDLRVNDANRIK